jgi:hypothetical protein
VEHPTGDGVVDETANSGDESAYEKDQVLANQPVLPELHQAPAEIQARACLHSVAF